LVPARHAAGVDHLAVADDAGRGLTRLLNKFADGAVIDEVQRCPDLFSWLQGMIDQQPRLGRFVITGSSTPAWHVDTNRTSGFNPRCNRTNARFGPG
jgi:hypothetical protein